MTARMLNQWCVASSALPKQSETYKAPGRKADAPVITCFEITMLSHVRPTPNSTSKAPGIQARMPNVLNRAR